MTLPCRCVTDFQLGAKKLDRPLNTLKNLISLSFIVLIVILLVNYVFYALFAPYFAIVSDEAKFLSYIMNGEMPFLNLEGVVNRLQDFPIFCRLLKTRSRLCNWLTDVTTYPIESGNF